MSVRYIAPDVIVGDGKRRSLDWIGYAYLIVGLGGGQWAIEMFSHGRPTLVALSIAMLSAGGFILFFRRYNRTGSGILDLRLLQIRTFRLSVSAGSVARAGVGGVPFLVPLLLLLGFHYDAFQSGLVTFLIAVGSAVVRPVGSLLMRLMGCRRLLLANSMVGGFGLLGFLLFRDKSSLWLIGPYVFGYGLMRSVQMSTMNALSYTDIEGRDMAAASTIASLAQRISIGLGVNVAAMVLTLASGNSRPGIEAFALAFIATALLVFVAGFMFTRLHPTDGWQISAHSAPKEATRRPINSAIDRDSTND